MVLFEECQTYNVVSLWFENISRNFGNELNMRQGPATM